MATLYNPHTKESIEDLKVIQNILRPYGVMLENWQANAILSKDSTQEEILKAYAHELQPFMEKNGFQTADVINVHPQTENILAIREKFMKEHTHSEDEVRFFVDGEGIFWFHFDNDDVLSLTCRAGDFLSVPRNYRHWFDLHPKYNVKAIRIFSNMEGWTPNYTNSGIDKDFNP